MKITGYEDNLDSNCGIKTFIQLQVDKPKPDQTDWGFQWYHEDPNVSKLKPKTNSAGWLLQSYTDHKPELEKVYDKLAKMYPIVYQSPVRKNYNSGNQFFFVIYDTSSLRKTKKNKKKSLCDALAVTEI